MIVVSSYKSSLGGCSTPDRPGGGATGDLELTGVWKASTWISLPGDDETGDEADDEEASGTCPGFSQLGEGTGDSARPFSASTGGDGESTGPRGVCGERSLGDSCEGSPDAVG